MLKSSLNQISFPASVRNLSSYFSNYNYLFFVIIEFDGVNRALHLEEGLKPNEMVMAYAKFMGLHQ